LATPTHKHLEIEVVGRVQGVFFRASTEEVARRLGLRGTVRNLSDGRRVAIVAEGNESDLKELLAWVRAGGPPLARVDEARESWSDAKSSALGDFNTIY